MTSIISIQQSETATLFGWGIAPLLSTWDKTQNKTTSGPEHWDTVRCPGTDGASFAKPNCTPATGQTVFSPIQRSLSTCSLKAHRLRTQHQCLSLWTEADLTARYCYRQAGINQRATHKAVLGGKVLTCISCFSGKRIKHCLLGKFTIPSFIHISVQIHWL